MVKKKVKEKTNLKYFLIILISVSLIFVTLDISGSSNNSNVANFISTVKDFLIEVNMGNVAGQELVHWFGDNDAVGTSEEDIWGNGGTLVHLTSAETMDIISTDTTNDIFNGINARSVIIIGLDENFTEINETVLLNNVVNTTTKEFIRIFRMFVVDVGGYGAINSGRIIATASTNGTVQSSIEIGEGQSTTTHYTVPAGKTAYILRASITMQTGKEVHVHLNIRENADDITVPFSSIRLVHHWEGLDVPVQEKFDANHKFLEKTDVWFAGSVTTGTAIIQANYDMLLVDN